MIALMLGSVTAFAQKMDKNEVKQLQNFLSQPAEKRWDKCNRTENH